MTTGDSTLLKQLEIPGGFDRTLYASERVNATATDGVKFLSPWFIERTSWTRKTSVSRAAIPSTFTATAPMVTRCRSVSVATGLACSIAA